MRYVYSKLLPLVEALAHSDKFQRMEAKYGVKFKYGKPALTSQKAPDFALHPDALPPGGFLS